MTAYLIDGRAEAARVLADVANDVRTVLDSGGQPPGLATILVGDDPASAVYVASKQRRCEEIGMVAIDRRLSAGASAYDVADVIRQLNADPEVSGILLQLPLPDHLPETHLIELIAPEKDVDGLTRASAGRLAHGIEHLVPCTPAGVIELLASAGVELAGAHVVIVGRSRLVGRPRAALLLARDATVTVCHSRTRDLASTSRSGDVLVAAVGRPGIIGAAHVRPGATVIDVGINRTADGRLVGDVDLDAVCDHAGAITPVPGGVGPMTIACLMRNTLQAALASPEAATAVAS